MFEAARELREAARFHAHGAAGARRFLPPEIDLDRFFEILREKNVQYVVLRWFDALPRVEEGEDVDLLVADDDLATVHGLLEPTPRRGSRKFDVYSVSGLPGSDFNGVPYYAPRFSRQLLADAVWLRERYRVPNPEHHFLSLGYHAVYHKGHAAGLPDGPGDVVTGERPDHDYARVLGELARRVDASVVPTLDDLDRYLHGLGLRPPLDTLERLVPVNPWIRERFFDTRTAAEEVWQGLAVFVLRERAHGLVEVATSELDRQGFEVLEVIHLDAEQRATAAHRLRGGNWERGPWPVSGGVPCTYVLAYDVAPRPGASADALDTNLRIPEAKEQVRQRLLRDVPPDELYNPVHSSDNPSQALDYLEALDDPAVEARVRGLAQRLVEDTEFPFPVRRLLPSHARRARVAVVDHPEHGASVCKLFRPGAVRFFERELRARRELCDLPEVPALLDHGDRWLVTPLYGDDRRHVVRSLPNGEDVQLRSSAARSLARLASDLHARNLFLLDLSTDNVVSDPGAGLKVLDWEFLQEYAEQAPPVTDSYTFRGTPAGTAGYDHPQQDSLVDRAGNPVFHPAVAGLPVERLLGAPRPADELRRACAQVRWWMQLDLDQRRRALRGRFGGSRWRRRLRTARALVHVVRRGRR